MLSFRELYESSPYLLTEGALGERLKREYHIPFHPSLAMAELFRDPAGNTALSALWREYADVARDFSLPLLLTTPTRRLNPERTSASAVDLVRYAQGNIAMLRALRNTYQADHPDTDIRIGALMGCRGDAYTGEGNLAADEARNFHIRTANAFASCGAEFLFAGIMPTLPEALGMARAMAETGIPYFISFTIRSDGCLIDGTHIADAVNTIDTAVSSRPLCYLTNCVHPTIVLSALSWDFNQTEIVRTRFRGIQANTSPLSYEELDGSNDLKTSAPGELAASIVRLKRETDFKLFGGCCGTDAEHLRAMAHVLRENAF